MRARRRRRKRSFVGRAKRSVPTIQNAKSQSSSPAKAGDPVFQRPQRLTDRPRRTGSPGQAGRRQRCLARLLAYVISCVTARRANHSKPVQPSREKYSASRSPQINPTTSAIPRPQEGRIAIVTDVGCGERWPRQCRVRNTFSQGGLWLVSEGRAPTTVLIADGEVVWACSQALF
jgi:hypothetical protein